MEDLLLIKLGGSIITDKRKPFTAKEEVIIRLGKEVLEAKRKYKGNIIIGHGSGSFGHSVASKYKTQEGLDGRRSIKGLSLVSDAAVQINRIVIKNFLEIGLPVVSFSPASFVLSRNQGVEGAFIKPIIHALEIGIVPVIYGDIIFDIDMGFCIFSGEKILNLLAEDLQNIYKNVKVIYCGDTNGVYDINGNTISKITPGNYKIFKKVILGSKDTDVTGGMLHKVDESLKMASSFAIETTIINGTKKGNLKKAILGNINSEFSIISDH